METSLSVVTNDQYHFTVKQYGPQNEYTYITIQHFQYQIIGRSMTEREDNKEICIATKYYNDKKLEHDNLLWVLEVPINKHLFLIDKTIWQRYKHKDDTLTIKELKTEPIVNALIKGDFERIVHVYYNNLFADVHGNIIEPL